MLGTATVAEGVPGWRKGSKQGKWRSRIDRRSLSWQENVVVSWTGMRGVVTLAAAAAIPVTTVDGDPFPERATSPVSLRERAPVRSRSRRGA